MRFLLVILLCSLTASAAEPAWKMSGRYNFVVDGDSTFASPSWFNDFLVYPGISVHLGRSTNAAVGGEFISNIQTQWMRDVFPLGPSGTTNSWSFTGGGINDCGPAVTNNVPWEDVLAAHTNTWYKQRTNGGLAYAFTVGDATNFHISAVKGEFWTNLNAGIIAASNQYDAICRIDLFVPWGSFTNTNLLVDFTHYTPALKAIIGAHIATNLLPVFIRPPATFNRLNAQSLTLTR